MTEESIELNKKLRSMIENFIKQNNLSCNSCSRCENGKCKAKAYCIVKDKVYFLAYDRKIVTDVKPMTERQKDCIEWIEEELGIQYKGENPQDFIYDHIEEARFKSALERESELSDLEARGDC